MIITITYYLFHVIITEFDHTQKFVDEIGELRAISSHVLGAAGVQIPKNNLDNLHSSREEDGTLETVDPQDLLGCDPLALVDRFTPVKDNIGCDPLALVDRFTPVKDNIGVNLSTSASGSQPSSNTKKDKIQQTPSSTQTFTIAGNACPSTKITTTTKVPLRKPISLESDTPKPVVTLVYSRTPKASKNNVPVIKSKHIKSLYANKKEPNKSWGSTVSNVLSSSLDECRCRFVDRISRKHTVYTISWRYDGVLSHMSLVKASKTKSWLWHQRLSHLNFDNGTEFVNQTLREYYEKVGISHETSVASSPQLYSVVERRNHMQIEVAHTIYFESYKEYYAITLGAKPPNTKASVKNKQVGSDTTMARPTAKGKRIKTSAKAVEPAKKKQLAKTSKAKGLIVLSEKSSKEDNDDEVKMSEEDDDVDNQSNNDEDDDSQEDDNQDDNEEQTDSYNDDDDEEQSVNVEGDELDKEEANKEDKDVSITTTAEPPLLSATTLPPPSTPIITHLQQTPVPSPADVLSSCLQDWK
nr:hypothetical protein [Tanacetum cinerariifolium]